MGYFSDASIDTRSWEEAADDATRDRLDGLYSTDYPLATLASPATFAAPAPLRDEPHAPAAQTAAPPSQRTDAAIAGALESFADEAQRLLDQAKAAPAAERDKDEIAYWRTQRNAFTKALHYFSQGIRLSPAPNGYTLPSASRAGAVIHRQWKVGGVWHCSCEAGERGLFHWHAALIAGYERSEDTADWNGYTDPETGYDADDYPDADEAAPMELGKRLALAGRFGA